MPSPQNESRRKIHGLLYKYLRVNVNLTTMVMSCYDVMGQKKKPCKTTNKKIQRNFCLPKLLLNDVIVIVADRNILKECVNCGANPI
jgi:hypothetical protein